MSERPYKESDVWVERWVVHSLLRSVEARRILEQSLGEEEGWSFLDDSTAAAVIESCKQVEILDGSAWFVEEPVAEVETDYRIQAFVASTGAIQDLSAPRHSRSQLRNPVPRKTRNPEEETS